MPNVSLKDKTRLSDSKRFTVEVSDFFIQLREETVDGSLGSCDSLLERIFVFRLLRNFLSKSRCRRILQVPLTRHVEGTDRFWQCANPMIRAKKWRPKWTIVENVGCSRRLKELHCDVVRLYIL